MMVWESREIRLASGGAYREESAPLRRNAGRAIRQLHRTVAVRRDAQ